MKRPQVYAVTITRREHAELLTAPPNDAPLAPTEVAGETVATLVSAGTELASAYQGDTFPQVPGYAAVFRVEQTGAEVRSLRAGDYAFCMGPHCSYQRHPEQAVLRLPDGMEPERAVFARLMGVSMSTLATTSARPPAKVVVTGLGPVGHLAAQVFASCGYEVMGCDTIAARRELALQRGIARVEEAIPLDDPVWAGQTCLVVECSGHEQAVLDGCRIVGKHGEVVLVGVPWKRQTQLCAQELLKTIFLQYAVLRSGWEWELPLHPADFRINSIWGNLRAALQWISEKKVNVDGLYSAYSPWQCQSAYQSLQFYLEPNLAVVFDWTRLRDGH